MALQKHHFARAARALEATGKVAGDLAKIAGAFTLIAMGLLFLQVRQEVRQTGIEARAMITETRALVADARSKVDDTSSNLNAILIQAGLAADQARQASVEQRDYLKQLNGNLDRTFSHVNELLAQAQDTTQTVGGDVHQISQATVTALNGLPPVLDQANKTLAASEKVISDPNIPATVAEVNKSMVAVTGTMQNVEKTTAHVEKKVDEMTRPVSWVKRVFTALFDIGYRAAIIIKH
jgi:ABC-type transporter Mla subunit MlaD